MIDVEPLIRTHLDRLAPLPDASTRDWADVRRRAHGSRPAGRVLVLAAAIALLAVALLVAAPALGFRQVADVFGSEPSPTWTWPEGVPGEPIEAPAIVRSGNEQLHGKLARDRVDLGSVRQIVSAGDGSAENAFLAARSLNGDVCLAKLGGGGHFGSLFECVHDPPKPGVPSSDEQAVFLGVSGGGHGGSVVDYSTIVGVARADVGRVELELVNGETIELPLNRWRGFGYSTTDASRFPKTLSVYRTWSSFFRSHEKLVGELPLQQVKGLEPTPLCGGVYGPCPPGVKP
ncbi:MAG TPA: hypothetical protein VGJ27_12005 [Gaiellaceae bacterium]